MLKICVFTIILDLNINNGTKAVKNIFIFLITKIHASFRYNLFHLQARIDFELKLTFLVKLSFKILIQNQF